MAKKYLLDALLAQHFKEDRRQISQRIMKRLDISRRTWIRWRNVAIDDEFTLSPIQLEVIAAEMNVTVDDLFTIQAENI